MDVKTVTGLVVDVFNPDPATVDFFDLANGAARLNVLRGQTSKRWSYAQRGLLAAALLEGNKAAQIAALLEVAVEAMGGHSELFNAAIESCDGLEASPGDIQAARINYAGAVLDIVKAAELAELTDHDVPPPKGYERDWLFNAARCLIAAEPERTDKGRAWLWAKGVGVDL